MTSHDLTEDEQLALRGGDIVRTAALSVSAPQGLRERIEREREQAARPAARRRRWQLGGALAGVVAAGALVVVLVGSGGSSGGQPTVLEASAFGLRPATAPAPTRDHESPNAVALREGAVQFPYWAADTPWHPSGSRTDTLGGHHATTVFYDAAGKRLAYTVVDVPALPMPGGGRVFAKSFTFVRHGDRNVVTWRAHGQTCIISAPSSVPAAKLVKLAMLDA